jgi:hypothetical protein
MARKVPLDPPDQLEIWALMVLMDQMAPMVRKVPLDPPDLREIWALMVTMARTVKTVRTQTSSSLVPTKRSSREAP